MARAAVPQATQPPAVVIRRGRPADIYRAAELCARVFHERPQRQSISSEASSYLSISNDLMGSLYSCIDRWQVQRSIESFNDLFMRCLDRKTEACLETRSSTLGYRYIPPNRIISLRRRRKWQLILAEKTGRDGEKDHSRECLQEGYAPANQPHVLGSVTIGIRLIEVAFRVPSEPKLYIANMVVHPQHRGQGIARMILRHCHLLARRWREPAVYLHVDKTNQRAIDLYKSEGYELARDYGYVDIRILMKKTIHLDP